LPSVVRNRRNHAGREASRAAQCSFPLHRQLGPLGIEDPAAVEGTDIQKETAFVTAFRYLRNRISLLTALPLKSLDKMALGTKLREIGRTEGATSARPNVA
jgi:arsenate reductase (thioredoxin)